MLYLYHTQSDIYIYNLSTGGILYHYNVHIDYNFGSNVSILRCKFVAGYFVVVFMNDSNNYQIDL